MFTGLVEERGILSFRTDSSGGTLFRIQAKKVLEDTKPGDSIMVDGVCLTVTELLREEFSAFVSKTTLETSTLSKKKMSSSLHLERAMRADSRFGGHIMSGHVDLIGKVIDLRKEGEIYYLSIALPEKTQGGIDAGLNIVEKGSIGIDGVSLTITAAEDSKFRVTIIPESSKRTNLTKKENGDEVNLEFDMLGKYVQKTVRALFTGRQNNLDIEKLKQFGF